MDVNIYLLQTLAELRVADMRAQATRDRLARATGSAAPRWRVALGHALIRLGHRLLDGLTTAGAPA